jgi:hypothetical protein
VLDYGLLNATFELPIHLLPKTMIIFLQINFFLKFRSNHWGENMVIKAKGAKAKVLFQGQHMTCVTFVLTYDTLPSHKVKLQKIETWRHAPGFQL